MYGNLMKVLLEIGERRQMVDHLLRYLDTLEWELRVVKI